MRGSGVIRIAARRIERREKKGGVAEVQVQVHARVAAKTGLIVKRMRILQLSLNDLKC